MGGAPREEGRESGIIENINQYGEIIMEYTISVGADTLANVGLVVLGAVVGGIVCAIGALCWAFKGWGRYH